MLSVQFTLLEAVWTYISCILYLKFYILLNDKQIQSSHTDAYVYNVSVYVYVCMYREYANYEKKFPFLNSTLSFYINLFSPFYL